jgi:putative membrane protein
MKIDYIEQLGIFLRGFLMGMCDVIPGVSGGTIALITGIYERLINAIGCIEPRMILSFLRFDKQAILADLKQIDFIFLAVLACGIGIAFFLMSRIITYFLQELPQITYAFFFGLILASCVYLLRGITDRKYEYIIPFIIGFIVGFLLIGFKPAEIGHSPLIIFITGMVALCAMILPGTSGAYIVLLFGQYEYMLTSLHSFVFVDIILFCGGGMVGLLIFTRILKYLLARYYAIMLSVLVGLMLGTSRYLYMEVETAGGFDLSAILAIFVGIAVIAVMTILTHKKEEGKEISEH